MDVAHLLASRPAFHLDAEGNPFPCEIAEELVLLLDSVTTAESRTLETGAGLSTAVFAINGSAHTCIVPCADEIDRIKAWCAQSQVSSDRIEFHHGRSEEILPRLPADPLDVVLIDGAHGFPSPFIDWYYAGRRLREGGVVVIDDTHLWTGRVLKRFLEEQPGWEIAHKAPMRFAAFRRTGDAGELADWVHQPYVVRRSFSSGLRGLPRKAIRAGHLARRSGVGALLARKRGPRAW
jgi:predicted O-methyltransferase YrrM